MGVSGISRECQGKTMVASRASTNFRALLCCVVSFLQYLYNTLETRGGERRLVCVSEEKRFERRENLSIIYSRCIFEILFLIDLFVGGIIYCKI